MLVYSTSTLKVYATRAWLRQPVPGYTTRAWLRHHRLADDCSFSSALLCVETTARQALGAPVRNFLDQIIQSGKTHPSVGCTFLWQLRKEVEEEGVLAHLSVSLPD